MTNLEQNPETPETSAQITLTPRARFTWFVVILILQFLYFPINRALQGGVTLATPWDRLIPLWPIWAVPYLLGIVWWLGFLIWATWKMDRCVCMSSRGVCVASEAVKVGPTKGARYRPQAVSRFHPRLHLPLGEEMDDKRVYISGQGACTASEMAGVRQARGRTVSTPSKNRFCQGLAEEVCQLAGTLGEDEWKLAAAQRRGGVPLKYQEAASTLTTDLRAGSFRYRISSQQPPSG